MARYENDDHDILIEIRTLSKLNHDSFVGHVAEDATRFGKLGDKLDSLHRRIDGLLISGVLMIIGIVLAWMLKSKGAA